jgi:hypothetical protein
LAFLTQSGLTIFPADIKADGSANGIGSKVRDIQRAGRFVEYITLLLKFAYWPLA